MNQTINSREMPAEDWLTLTKATMQVMDSWNLRAEEMRDILGLPEDTRVRSFQKYRSHEAFPVGDDIDKRIDYLLRIAGALRTTYPANPSAGGKWLRQKHRRMGCAPLSLMVNDGENGLVSVLAELDATFCWDLSGSQGH